jgi:nicotinate-nucleotide pyrophosphorylase (carboxylating)
VQLERVLLPDPALVDEVVRLSLREDVGRGDVTTLATVPPDQWGRARIVAKAAGVVAGLPVATRVFRLLDARCRAECSVADGEACRPAQALAEVTGPLRAVLSGERVALNFLQRLSGIATLTRRYVEALACTRAQVVDTRKTTPGLRALEKYAVRVGGGRNHRFGLDDGILIKENHVRAAGGVAEAVARARQAATHLQRVQVEVRDLEELEEAVRAGADAVLLDNMELPTIAEAVRRVAGRAVVEASGNMGLERARAAAEAGVDLVSVGALTHSAPALDVSLLVEETWSEAGHGG